ncbi:hypothetical protein RCL1_001010 [Eukaryota sp. TZLM3-RCL]
MIPSVALVVTGDIIERGGDFLKGYGTGVKDENLTATVTGVVQRLNKLVTVHPYKSRYKGEVGDIVVGKVVEVGNKRWKIDIGARQHAVLQLSAINLPNSEVRRRSALDELNMRNFYSEGDIVSVEVQQVYVDGSLALHTRRRYGKLQNGTLLVVSSSLIKRSPSQLLPFPELGLELVIGRNGHIWIGPLITDEHKNAALQGVGPTSRGHFHFYGYANEITMSPTVLRNVAMIRNALNALNVENKSISETNLREVLARTITTEPKQMLEPHVIKQITDGLV